MDGLPRARAPAMRPPPQVLVIDDSVEVLDTLSAVLRQHYRVLVARSGPAGLEIARRRPAPDLVLLDVVMPVMDGYAVLSELKANVETRDIPVIFLTALAGTEDEERGLERGAADYVSKPVKPLNLLARVRNHLAIANRTAALAASEARMRAVVEGARDAIFTTDDDGRILSINSEGSRIFGYTRDELIGADVRSIINRAPGVNAGSERGLGNGDARRMEIPGRRRDGALFPLEYAASRILVDGKWINVCFGRDLSPQRAAEATMQRLRSERITAIGGVASALAHEVNQPFLAAVAYLDTARHILETIKDDRGSPLDDAVRSASDEIMRAGQIIGHLREFASSGEPDKTFQSLHSLIEGAVAAAAADLEREQISVHLELQATDCRVLADKLQIKQVLANLIRNATQAMRGLERRELAIRTSSSQTSVFLHVVDTGAGLSEEAIDRLFEPFVTTKKFGLGLGLAISRSIIDAHYGAISARANPDGGATFSIKLPLADGLAHDA